MDVYAKGAPETIASLCQPQTGETFHLYLILYKTATSEVKKYSFAMLYPTWLFVFGPLES